MSFWCTGSLVQSKFFAAVALRLREYQERRILRTPYILRVAAAEVVEQERSKKDTRKCMILGF